MRKLLVSSVFVFILFAQHHHTHATRTFGEFQAGYECEQARITLERTTSWSGWCVDRPARR